VSGQNLLATRLAIASLIAVQAADLTDAVVENFCTQHTGGYSGNTNAWELQSSTDSGATWLDGH
jgi:hypothetical protein